MKKLVLAGLIALVMSTSALAQSGSATLILADKYATRGIVATTEEVVQGVVDITLSNGIGLQIFENTDLTGVNGNERNATELDLLPYYAFDINDELSAQVGIVQYTFPNTEYTDSYELFTKLFYSIYELDFWYDVDQVDSWYASVIVAPTLNLCEHWDVGLLGVLGYAGSKYNEAYFGTDQYAFNDLTASAWVSYTVNSISTALSYGYTWLPDSDIREGAEDIYMAKVKPV
jgi:hypothetical protein